MASRAQKKFIYFPIESKLRELSAKVWLASQVASKDFVCILGDKPGVKSSMELYPPGIYFDKSLSRNKYAKLDRIHKTGNSIVAQDEEAGIARTEIESFFRVRLSEQNLKLSGRYYCWGSEDYNFLLGKYSNLSERIKLTGSPRIDLWRPEVSRGLYEEETAELVSRFGDFVLVNSSFGITSEGEIRNKLDQMIGYGHATSESRAAHEGQLEKRLREFRNFVEVIQSVARRRPDVNFVVRPHPGESIADWRSQLKETKNLRLIRQGDVGPWISACRTLLHEGCTTALQAVVMGKPVISYVPKLETETREKSNDFPNLVSERTNSLDQLLESLDRAVSTDTRGIEERRRRLDIIETRIASTTGKYAAELISQDLATLPIESYSYPSIGQKMLRRQFHFIKKLTRKVTEFGAPSDSRYSQRSPIEKMPGGIQKLEVESLLERLKSVVPINASISVKQLGKNVVELVNGE